MKSQLWPFLCALVPSLVPSFASADEPSLATWVAQRVGAALVKPLAQQESNNFSRGRRPPSERRVRALQSTVSRDKQERPFVPFAIDARFGSEWREGAIVGCVYRSSGSIFVKIGDAHRPAAFLLGKDVEPVAGVCEAAPPRA